MKISGIKLLKSLTSFLSQMHNGLVTNEYWQSLDTYSQLANIGSEIGRSFKWKKNNSPERANAAFFRAWELFYATLADKKNLKRKKEINICRELFADLFFDRAEYKETPEHFELYFIELAILARNKPI